MILSAAVYLIFSSNCFTWENELFSKDYYIKLSQRDTDAVMALFFIVKSISDNDCMKDLAILALV